MTDTEIHTAVVSGLIAGLLERQNGDDPDADLAEAGEFVGLFGSIVDALGGRAAQAQQWASAPQSAWDHMAHWSVVRGDCAGGPTPDFHDHVAGCRTCTFLEGTYINRTALIEDPCGRCGDGPDRHHFGPAEDYTGEAPNFVKVLDWGSPTYWCVEPWTRTEPKAVGFRDVYPNQDGDGFYAAWTAPLADGTFATVTRAFYFARVDDDGVTVMLGHSYLTCTDPTRPWETEIAGGTEHAEEYDEDVEYGEYDLQALAEHIEGPERDEWATQMPDAVEFVWNPPNT